MPDEFTRIETVSHVLREWISVAAYSRKYGISRHTLYKWIDAGVVTSYRVDRLVRVRDTPPQSSPDISAPL